MTSEQRSDELKGALFKNDKREHDRQPHYKGQALIDGRKYWISAWIRVSKSNVKYMSLSFTAEQPQPSFTPAGDEDGDIPF